MQYRRILPAIMLLVFAAGFLPAADTEIGLAVGDMPPLPAPIANNAVASVTAGGRHYLVSFNGLGQGRTQSDTKASTYVFNGAAGSWSEADAVPGGTGRLASVAATVGELAYVFGGYSVAEDGAEVSTPWVHSFDPIGREFTELAPMPVPVDDAVAATYDDRFIYLISGWHDYGNVNLVQRYDTVTDSWTQATPIPGTALFGHAGGIIGKRMFYCDGVAVHPFPDKPRDFAMSDECFLGLIDEEDSRRIDWRRMPAHPGLPRYRMAAAGIHDANAILFIGGSENPYNYNGVGYDGEPSEPASGALLFDIGLLEWRTFEHDAQPSMDHRALVSWQGQWVTVGGMVGGQQVSNKVLAYTLIR